MTDTTTFNVSGMHCNGCASKIRSAILALDGIHDANVSHAEGLAIITAVDSVSVDQVESTIASAGDYVARVMPEALRQSPRAPEEQGDGAPAESLYPLMLIIGFIGGTTTLIAFASGTWSVEAMMRHFMAGFFIVFSFFKLLDPPGFVAAYRSYDLIAGRVPVWGWVYPYVELAIGVAYLLAFAPLATNLTTLVLMLVGAAGVLGALLQKRTIRCACLGTALNLPMTKVTLVEDLAMAAMAAGMLILIAAR